MRQIDLWCLEILEYPQAIVYLYYSYYSCLQRRVLMVRRPAWEHPTTHQFCKKNYVKRLKQGKKRSSEGSQPPTGLEDFPPVISAPAEFPRYFPRWFPPVIFPGEYPAPGNSPVILPVTSCRAIKGLRNCDSLSTGGGRLLGGILRGEITLGKSPASFLSSYDPVF